MRVFRAIIVLTGILSAAALPQEDMARLATIGASVAHATGNLARQWIGGRAERIHAIADDPLTLPSPRPVQPPVRIAEEATQAVRSDASIVAAEVAAVPMAATPPATAASPPPANAIATSLTSQEAPAARPTSSAAQASAAPVSPPSRVIPIGASPAMKPLRVAQDGSATPHLDQGSIADDDADAAAPSEPAAAVPHPAVPPPVAAVEQTAAVTPPASHEPPEPERRPAPPPKKEPIAAKLLFGAVKTPAPLAARSIGFYSRGCLAGGKALEVDGPAWQAMRLSRNRNWGHPKLVALIERFAKDVQKEDGWPGILVGDMSQPRGGPMLTGHASHQVGLDADIWLTPMPARRLSKTERENLSATSMLESPTKVDPAAFTPNHVKVLKRAASYPEVERILVHPAIKKALCEAAGKDNAWLYKIRPYYGHYYHFHMRLKCQPGSTNCRPQPPPNRNDPGCGKELTYWFKLLTRPPRKPAVTAAKPSKPVKKRPPVTLADLPAECRVVLEKGNEGRDVNEKALVEASEARAAAIIDISGKPRREVLAKGKR